MCGGSWFAYLSKVTDEHEHGVTPHGDDVARRTPLSHVGLEPKRAFDGAAFEDAVRAHVAYVPGGLLHGCGRIARLVDAIAHRFTYQEWLTRDVADALVVHGKAKGAACIVEAEQLCLLLGEDRRGDERVVTRAYAGAFGVAEQAELQRLVDLR